jgi:hypothetical protein
MLFFSQRTKEDLNVTVIFLHHSSSRTTGEGAMALLEEDSELTKT